jgi:hypothetical protein
MIPNSLSSKRCELITELKNLMATVQKVLTITPARSNVLVGGRHRDVPPDAPENPHRAPANTASGSGLRRRNGIEARHSGQHRPNSRSS